MQDITLVAPSTSEVTFISDGLLISCDGFLMPAQAMQGIAFTIPGTSKSNVTSDGLLFSRKSLARESHLFIDNCPVVPDLCFCCWCSLQYSWCIWCLTESHDNVSQPAMHLLRS